MRHYIDLVEGIAVPVPLQPRLTPLREYIDLVEARSYLAEDFLGSIRQKLGNAIQQNVTAVTNTASALQVIYKIATNTGYLDKVVIQLNKQLYTTLKALPN